MKGKMLRGQFKASGQANEEPVDMPAGNMIFEHEGHRYPSELQPGALGKVSGSLNFREACNSAELKKNKMKSLCFIPAMNNNSSLEWS